MARSISILFGWRYVAPSAILDDTPLPLADEADDGDGLSLCELASRDDLCYLRVVRRIHDDLYVAHVAASPDLLDTEPHTAYFSADQLAHAHAYDCRLIGKPAERIRAVLSACAAARLPEPTPAPRRVAPHPVQRPHPVSSQQSEPESTPEPAPAPAAAPAPAEPELVALPAFYVSHKQVEQQLAQQNEKQPLSPASLRRSLQSFLLRCVLSAAAGWREMCATIKRLLGWLRSTQRKPRVVSLSEVYDEEKLIGWNVLIGVPPELAAA